MKTIYRIAGSVAILVGAAAAQENADTVVTRSPTADIISIEMKQQLREALSQATVVGVRSAVMGPAVKGAPYSAIEITENLQVLGDGTHIDRKTQTNIYRDKEGRVRRETPEQVTIWDPVAGTSYFLDPKTQTARKMVVNSYVGRGDMRVTGATGPGVAFFANGSFAAGEAAPPLPPPPPLSTVVFGANVYETHTGQKPADKSESLGNQMINGVNAAGTRMTATIEAGAIGNDRPIQIVSESWYSNELQTMVKSSHSDPRTGQETFELTNISRSEPGAELFEVPPGYEVTSPR